MFSKCVEFITPGTGRCQQNELRWGLRTLKYAKAFTPRTSNYCLSTRRFPKCGRCSGAIYSQYNIDNLLSLSREGGITSSRKGIVDNLSMTYDGNMLASVSDSAPAPSVTGSADFRGGMSGNAGAHPVEGGVSVAGGSLEIGGETGGMELARPGASQPYRFLGNELYTSNSLGLYDFSARMYDPALGRFLSVDPMAEGYRHLSPYAYCAGNPAVYVDKDGQVIGRVVVGAVVGAAINGGIALLSGESGREVLGAAARGAIEGGVAGLTFGMSMGTTLAGKIAVSAAVGAATSTASSTVGQLVESGGVDAKVVATDAAVGAVVGGASRVFPFNTLENANKKATSHLSPSNYVETARKDVKKEWRATGKGLSGQSARAEFRKEVSDRANNLYKVDVLLIDSGYNMAGYTVNNVVQMEASHLIQKQNDKRD